MAEPTNVQLAALQDRITAAIKRAKPATVRIAWGDKQWDVASRDKEWNVVSGVIVSAEGHIATQCQYPNPMHSAVAIYLADGRRVTAKVLGSCWAWDIRVLKIIEKGPWPCAELGKSTALKPGDLCVALGYPAICAEPEPYQFDREPAPRVGRIRTSAAPWWLAASCRLIPGHMTGGGLFDLDGRLIGIHCQFRPDDGDYGSTIHAAVELIQKYWGVLISDEQEDAASPASSGKGATGSELAPARESRLATLQEHLHTPIDRCSLVTVGVGGDKPGETSFSGVIVSADGYIVTCGHHGLPFGDERAIYLSDGRVTRANVLPWNPIGDVGLMKITEPGPWPHVEMGGSMASKRGDLCLMIGYPRRRLPVFQRRHPALRLGFVVDSTDEPGRLFTTCYVDSGDSGGGVFDLQGRLIGIAVGESTKFGKAATDCRAVGLFQLQWDFLTSGTLPATAAPSDVGAAVTEFQRLTPSVSPIVVEVRQGEKRCSLGTIVGSDGWVLTRASTLGDSVSCRLADGRELPARIGRVSRVHDLAMIRVEATGLPEADWTEHEEIPVGTLVAAVRFPREEAPAVGMVYRAAHPAPSEPGRLPIGKGQNVEGGVEIRDLTELEAGLPAVVDSDMALAVDSFGGPVIDHSGKVVAVTFAPSAYNGLVYLLPAAIAAKVSDRLKSR